VQASVRLAARGQIPAARSPMPTDAVSRNINTWLPSLALAVRANVGLSPVSTRRSARLLGVQLSIHPPTAEADGNRFGLVLIEVEPGKPRGAGVGFCPATFCWSRRPSASPRFLKISLARSMATVRALCVWESLRGEYGRGRRVTVHSDAAGRRGHDQRRVDSRLHRRRHPRSRAPYCVAMLATQASSPSAACTILLQLEGEALPRTEPDIFSDGMHDA